MTSNRDGELVANGPYSTQVPFLSSSCYIFKLLHTILTFNCIYKSHCSYNVENNYYLALNWS